MLSPLSRGSRRWLGGIISGFIAAGLLAASFAGWFADADHAVSLVGMVSAGEPRPEPARLAEPAPIAADPITVDEPPLVEPGPESTANHSAVRNVIKEQLPNASAEEQDIWYNQLKSLPPGVVEDILRLRQEIRRPSSPLWLPFPKDASSEPPGAFQPPPQIMVPAEISSAMASGWSTRETLRRMREITLQNLLHAHTPGYCRLVPLTSPVRDSHAAEELQVALRWDGVTLELDGVEFQQTHRPLDIATTGRGWLEFAAPDGSVYTRSAHLSLHADGRLGISAGSEFLPLVPETTIPASVVRVEITPAGNVQAWGADDEEPIEIASLVLAAPRDAESMTYSPHGWLMPKDLATPVARNRPGTHGFDMLCIGMLAKSNVDVAAERARLEVIDGQLQRLTPSPRYGHGEVSELQDVPSY